MISSYLNVAANAFLLVRVNRLGVDKANIKYTNFSVKDKICNYADTDHETEERKKLCTM